MEHKRDATVAGLGWPSNPNRGLASTALDPVSGGQASELCHSIAPEPTTSTTSAPSAVDITTNDIGTMPHTDAYSALHFLMFLSRLSQVLPTTSSMVLTSHHG